MLVEIFSSFYSAEFLHILAAFCGCAIINQRSEFLFLQFNLRSSFRTNLRSSWYGSRPHSCHIQKRNSNAEDISFHKFMFSTGIHFSIFVGVARPRVKFVSQTDFSV